MAAVIGILGAVEFLKGIDPSHWAVVTSAPHELAAARMDAVGLPAPGGMIMGVVNGRHDPEGFLAAVEARGAPISDCLVFEDFLAGVEAARVTGARVVIVVALAEPAAGAMRIAIYRTERSEAFSRTNGFQEATRSVTVYLSDGIAKPAAAARRRYDMTARRWNGPIARR